eukprot:m.34261 g.34261  ORF g.34261 m.34261 type:complete len:181 (+) comp15433_c0_seq1:48-590(+)
MLFLLCLCCWLLSACAVSVYDFEALEIGHSTATSLREFEGKPMLIANVASYCGFTDSGYSDLINLHRKFGDELSILAFPCNQFGQQEPGSAEEIMEFAQGKGVDFHLFERMDVNGPDAHPLYVWLREQSGNRKIEWNFVYFLISRKGKVVHRFKAGADLRDRDNYRIIRREVEGEMRGEL